MIAAANWLPRAPPALRSTVFTAVADPVLAAGTAATTWFGNVALDSPLAGELRLLLCRS